MLRHPDGRVEALEDADNLLLGVTTPTRRSARRRLERGSTLLLYTDGLVERRGEHLQDGLDRLRAALAAGPQDVHELVGALVRRLDGSDDDVALMAVRLA